MTFQTRSKAARHSYDWGCSAEAARLYHEAAGREKERRNIAGEMDALRWAGNSLIWSGQHPEAMRLLIEVATCDHPQADPGSVFGAMTDCIMIALFHAPAVACKKLLSDARAHLERIGKPHWRHRLELETSILHFRQGQFQAAADTAVQAFRLRQATTDGPSYTRFAHLKWITRSLFLLRQEALLAEWVQSAEREPITMLSDRNRLSCIRILLARIRRASGHEPHGMLEEARAAANNVEFLRYAWDEIFEVARALLLAGDLEALDRLPLNQPCALSVVQSAFAVEREINLLRLKLQLPLWDAELNWPSQLPEALPSNANFSPSEVGKLEPALAELATAARAEDQRMETTTYSEAAQIRALHAHALLRAVGLESG